MKKLQKQDINQEVFDLYDEYAHNKIDRRVFLERLSIYAVGGLTVGYQWSEEDLGISANEQQYDNDGYGVTFAINDDLSVGYNHYESEQSNTTNVTAEATSVQIAYSMGGASIRLAESSSDNEDYQTGANYDREATTLSVSLAF